MTKKIKAIVKLNLLAGKAVPGTPIGPCLGQYGIQIAKFIKEYNSRTENNIGLVIPAKITIFDDKSYTFILKSPPTSLLLLKYAGITKGSNDPKNKIVGFITYDQLLEIIKIKMVDLNTQNLSKIEKIIEGTAKNLGIKIKNSINSTYAY